VSFAGYLVGGVGNGIKNVLLRVLLTTRVPEEVQGRAFAAYNAARNAAELSAVAAGGLMVGLLGPRLALLIAGLGPVLAALVGLGLLRRYARSASRWAASPVTAATVRTAPQVPRTSASACEAAKAPA
jgi:MFS family permease